MKLLIEDSGTVLLTDFHTFYWQDASKVGIYKYFYENQNSIVLTVIVS